MYTKWHIRAFDRDHYIATWDRVLLQVWRHETSLDALVNLGRIGRSFTEEERSPISSLAIIEASAPPPSEVARKELSSFYRDLGPKMSATIVVPEGSGFRSAFVRGVGLTLSTLAPRALPFKFCSTVGDAAEVIGPFLSPLAGGAEGLVSAVEELRRDVAPGAPGAPTPR